MAIAFDAASGPTTVNPGTSATLSHTCSAGSNRMLFAGVMTATDDIVSVTYAGTGMTFVVKQTNASDSNRYLHIYCLPAPATGANNIVVTTTNSELIRVYGISYTGVNQSTTMDNSTSSTDNDGGSTYSLGLTTVADNCWTLLHARNTFGNTSAGSGTTLRTAAGFNALLDSNAAITPAGSSTLNASTTSGANWTGVMVSFAPASSTSVKDIISSGILPFVR